MQMSTPHKRSQKPRSRWLSQPNFSYEHILYQEIQDWRGEILGTEPTQLTGTRGLWRGQGPDSRRYWKVEKNFKHYDLAALLCTYSWYKQKFAAYKKFQALQVSVFRYRFTENWLWRPETFPAGLSRKVPQARDLGNRDEIFAYELPRLDDRDETFLTK